MKNRRMLLLLAGLVVVLGGVWYQAMGPLLGWDRSSAGGGVSAGAGAYLIGNYSPADSFRDDITKGNTEIAADQMALDFVDSDGKPVDLRKFQGKKNVVLVVTRGFPGYVCPYCSAQTSRLISNYAEFSRRNAEVLVVFPGKREHIPKFVKAVKDQTDNKAIPFPILLDEDLKVVGRLGIRDQLAKPSVYILDKSGQVSFAYVGATAVDRPRVKVLLSQLDGLAEKTPSASTKPTGER